MSEEVVTPAVQSMRDEVVARASSERLHVQSEPGEAFDYDGPPALPREAREGIFGDYLSLMGPTTEAADSYHFVVFSVLLGVILRKRLYVYHAREVYPNIYCVLVGPTGIGRKDTTQSRGWKVLNALFAQGGGSAGSMPEIIPGVGSTEGLLALDGAGKTVILAESEFLSLMNKAKQDSVSTLVPKLTSLWDCPPMETLKTKHNPVTCIDPFLSIISGTAAWLKKALIERDVGGGFANRFLFVCGQPKPPIGFPPKPDTKRFSELITRLNTIRSCADELHRQGHGELTVPPATKRIFESYYERYYVRCSNETLGANLIARIQTYLWKFCLLFAACDLSAEIRPEHIDRAIIIADFLERSMLYVFHGFGGDPIQADEAELLRYLRGKGQVSNRDVYSGLHWSAAKLGAVAKPLVAANLVKLENKKGLNGRAVQYLKVLF
ncbi:MAG: DUF3987 domain-containing protein [Dehalococcoidia bacterium]|nr:DUF3987 domain-containing protein [Dehalococcoidia bacterium]